MFGMIAGALLGLALECPDPQPNARPNEASVNYPRSAADLNRERPSGFRVPSLQERWSR